MSEQEKQELIKAIDQLKRYVHNRIIVESDNPETNLDVTYKKLFVKNDTKPVSSTSDQGQSPKLKSIQEEVLSCKGCDLHKTKTNYVFGEGNPNADLMFIGEAPGYNEDVQGRPFVGRAGKLLDKMLNAMDLDRSKVYIANILKCRPPNNRNPLPEEVLACTGYLEEQIRIIKPKVICSLGLFAGQFLLDNPMVRMGDIR